MEITPKDRPKTTKILEENLGGKLHDIGFDNDFFLRYDSESTGNESKKGQADYIKLKGAKCINQ